MERESDEKAFRKLSFVDWKRVTDIIWKTSFNNLDKKDASYYPPSIVDSEV